MRYFDVRQPATASAEAAWPQQAPELHMIELPTRLRVPLATRSSPTPLLTTPPGTLVTKGQRLCECGVAGAPTALAPTSGRIVGESQAQLLNGHTVPALDLEPDFEDRAASSAAENPPAPHEHPHKPENIEQQIGRLVELQGTDLPTWIDRLRDAGIWADRVASPDLLQQLHRALRQPVDTVLCTLLDDEPTMRLNGVLAARSGPLLVAGVRLLARLTEARQAMLVVETGAPARWWAPIRRLTRKADIALAPVLNDYPQSHPTLLAYTLLDRRLKPGRLPIEQRALVLDGAAAVAIGRYVTRQQPMLQVPFAVRDHLSGRAHFCAAPVGTPLRHVLHQLGVPFEHVELRRGEVLRENAASPDAVLAAGELVLHVMPPSVPRSPAPCIRCSWCLESCPTRVQPAGLLDAAQALDLSLAQHYGLDACIECGVCSYVCPSHLPLLAGIRKLKSQ